MDWCEWFGFEFDPFFDKPLETDQAIRNLMAIEKRALYCLQAGPLQTSLANTLLIRSSPGPLMMYFSFNFKI